MDSLQNILINCAAFIEGTLRDLFDAVILFGRYAVLHDKIRPTVEGTTKYEVDCGGEDLGVDTQEILS